MKLEVGMYVRTEHSGICKLYREFSEDSVDVGIGVLPEINGFFIDEKEVDWIERKEILKASFDILDLIEAGDVISLSEDIDNFKKEYIIGIPDLITLDAIKEKIENGNLRLVGIVTKERFENIESKFVN